MFKGTYTALVTPFRDNQIDSGAYARLIRQQIDAGINGIVPVGTTGESPTLDHEEHIRAIRLAVDAAAGQCKVIAGTGSNCTREAIAMTREAEGAKADGALLVAPYYNKPSQEGLFRHFKAIAESTSLPLVLYSIPGRCGIEIGIDTVVRLAHECPNIVSIKEAGGNVDRVSQLRVAGLPENFTILSGDDSLTLPFLAAGAVGVISVASNLFPGPVVDLVRCCLHGKFDAARALHERYYRIFKDLFIEPNPVPVKTAMAQAYDWITPDVRPPLCEMSGTTLEQLQRTLAALQ